MEARRLDCVIAFPISPYLGWSAMYVFATVNEASIHLASRIYYEVPRYAIS